jgi:hypothetical protein
VTPSQLTARLESYLSLRLAMGFPMKLEESQLRDFVAFLTASAANGRITAQLAIEWACSSPRRGASARAGRLNTARGLLRYLSAFAPDVEVPEAGLLAGGAGTSRTCFLRPRSSSCWKAPPACIRRARCGSTRSPP